VLARLVAGRGALACLRSDNGSELVAQALQDWLRADEIQSATTAPGKPWQNGANESFNGKFRAECLDVDWFPTRREALVVVESWRRHDNDEHPHSSLGYQTPSEFAQAVTPTGTAAVPKVSAPGQPLVDIRDRGHRVPACPVAGGSGRARDRAAESPVCGMSFGLDACIAFLPRSTGHRGSGDDRSLPGTLASGDTADRPDVAQRRPRTVRANVTVHGGTGCVDR
jgi:putative transposase